jgi:hypothetical protein
VLGTLLGGYFPSSSGGLADFVTQTFPRLGRNPVLVRSMKKALLGRA